MSNGWVRGFLREHDEALTREGVYAFIAKAQRLVRDMGHLDASQIAEAEKRFILVRAKPDHDDRWLVNRLVAEYVPFDFVSTFVFHKPLFYERYQQMGENQREHVVKTLEDVYVRDKKSFRARLYASD